MVLGEEKGDGEVAGSLEGEWKERRRHRSMLRPPRRRRNRRRSPPKPAGRIGLLEAPRDPSVCCEEPLEPTMEPCEILGPWNSWRRFDRGSSLPPPSRGGARLRRRSRAAPRRISLLLGPAPSSPVPNPTSSKLAPIVVQ